MDKWVGGSAGRWVGGSVGRPFLPPEGGREGSVHLTFVARKMFAILSFGVRAQLAKEG